jgi:hypothetical protein
LPLKAKNKVRLTEIQTDRQTYDGSLVLPLKGMRVERQQRETGRDRQGQGETGRDIERQRETNIYILLVYGIAIKQSNEVFSG